MCVNCYPEPIKTTLRLTYRIKSPFYGDAPIVLIQDFGDPTEIQRIVEHLKNHFGMENFIDFKYEKVILYMEDEA